MVMSYIPLNAIVIAYTPLNSYAFYAIKYICHTSLNAIAIS